MRSRADDGAIIGGVRHGPAGAPRRAAITTWRRIETITRLLESCRARPNEAIVVIASARTDPELVDIVTVALERLGCSCTVLTEFRTDLDPCGPGPVAIAATESANLVLDLSGGRLFARALAAPSEHRRLVSFDLTDARALDHLVSHPGLRQRVERAITLIGRSAVLTLSSAAGTAVEVELEGADVDARTGIADVGATAERWPSGAVSIAPTGRVLEGSVVLMPGDMFVEAALLTRSPVRVEIAAGRVVDVLGDSADADVVRSELEVLEPSTSPFVAAVVLGLNLTRGLDTLGLFDPRWLADGRAALTAGRSSIVLTGTDPTRGRRTLVMHDVSLAVDGVDLTTGGVLTGTVAPDPYELAAC